jgi:hypothetical protein
MHRLYGLVEEKQKKRRQIGACARQVGSRINAVQMLRDENTYVPSLLLFIAPFQDNVIPWQFTVILLSSKISLSAKA